MSLVGVVIVLIVIGFLLWLAVTYIPMEPTMKRIIVAFVVIAVVIYLLKVIGIFDSVNEVPVPRVH